jgi:hypothetical protein
MPAHCADACGPSITWDGLPLTPGFGGVWLLLQRGTGTWRSWAVQAERNGRCVGGVWEGCGKSVGRQGIANADTLHRREHYEC